jgi:hypothetical protein
MALGVVGVLPLALTCDHHHQACTRTTSADLAHMPFASCERLSPAGKSRYWLDVSQRFDVRAVLASLAMPATTIRVCHIRSNSLNLRYPRSTGPGYDPNCTVALRLHICGERAREL